MSLELISVFLKLFDMTNKHASKQHGLHDVKRMQPSSKLRKRRNKKTANARKAEMREIIGMK